MDDTGYFRSPSLTAIKARLLKMHFDAGVGHIGGNLSCIDAIAHLHLRVMGAQDSFVLSKGHAAGALYATLWAMGELTDADLATYHQDGTGIAAHPAARSHRRIPFGTGSLGHGLGLAAGVALAKRLRHEPGAVYCLMGDGECQEGSVWEGLIFAAHHALSNLVILIDANGLQGFGGVDKVASMDSLTPRLCGFGLQVVEIDGHDPASLDDALRQRAAGPLVIVLKTVKGHGVSFMEGRMEWHYLPMNEEQYRQALRELEAA